jgi:TolB-like protein/Flp pilus assembly protein TadD
MHGPATDVFVSYKAEDRSRLAPLVAALEAEGFTVWWDQHIGGGTNWREEIEAHLDAANVVLVVWSKLTIGPEGRFVRDEASQAQEAGHYLPITIDNVRPPLGFREIQALDLSSWWGKRSDPRFKLLADTIRHRLEGGEIGPRTMVLSSPRISRRAAIGSAAGVAAVAAAGGWLLLKPEAANAKRIAVLPFADLSGSEEQAYFAEGIAEELRGALSRIGLQVIGRASSDAVKGLDAKEAAAKLDVAHMLTGSVRRSPDMIRIRAQLVGGRDGVERWAQSYDRAPGDEIKIQTDIATSVAQALSVALSEAGKAALELGGTADSAAQDLLLQGRALRQKATEETLLKSLALIEAAIARDPNYADAHVDKANALLSLAANFSTSPKQSANRLAMSQEAADRALAIAPNLGSAHAALSAIQQIRLNFSEALQHLRRAQALSPDSNLVLGQAVTFLPYVGKQQEALRLADRSIALDPLNGRGYRRKTEVLYAARQFASAVAMGRKALAIQPDNPSPNINMGFSLLLLDRPKEAQAAFRALPDGDPFRLTGEALAAARTGDAKSAEKWAAELWKQYGAAFHYQQAEIRTQMNQNERAFEELNNAFVARDSGLGYLQTDPFLDPLRSDPRFTALVKKLNFPA